MGKIGIDEGISEKLRAWYEINKRSMPWRLTQEPYKIWLSEVILQQTQVVQGTPYFEKFISEFPTLKDLAEASEDKVLKLWQGLGYYSRARNLLYTARFIHFELMGVFPKTYFELLKLKGVGEYTAAAIASISYNEPVAVVDGNVIRVISRLFKIDEPFNSGKGKKLFNEAAYQILDKNQPAQHNQAMMELGSLVCRPQNPDCNNCPLAEHCLALKDKVVLNYPIKLKKTSSKKLYFNFVVPVLDDRKTLITKRTGNDIWKNMYTFPLYASEEEIKEMKFIPTIREDFGDFEVMKVSKIKHILSHRVIHATFYIIALKESGQSKKNNIFEVEINRLVEFYSLPRLITKFMESKDVSIYFIK
jgi:A/G-specific adenine glycosylase